MRRSDFDSVEEWLAYRKSKGHDTSKLEARIAGKSPEEAPEAIEEIIEEEEAPPAPEEEAEEE